ncbi:MAG TPA: hypothetical protein VF503_33705 [Sphingobium sp.]|uniref:hypothetical protein n=1 Tax=Sphingobium sp. TaxID=1912891 RepID=UPI002ED50B8E
MVAFSKAADGQKDVLAQWYDQQHMNDLLAIPGLVSAERHLVQPLGQPDNIPDWDFMLIYEIDDAEPLSVIRTMGERRAAGQLIWTDALESAHSFSLIALSVNHVSVHA